MTQSTFIPSVWRRLKQAALVAGALLAGVSAASAGAYYGTVSYAGFRLANVGVELIGSAFTFSDGNGDYVIRADNQFGNTTLFVNRAGYTFSSYAVNSFQAGTVGPLNFVATSGPSPKADAIADVVAYGSSPSLVSVTGIGRGDPALSMSLTVTATSGNPALAPNPQVSYSSPNAAATLTLTPNANATGTSLITVTVRQQDNSTVTRTFNYTVNPISFAPNAGPATSLDFNGTNQYVTLQNFPLANSSFTVEFWARRRLTNVWQMLIAQGAGTAGQGLHIGFRPDNVFTLGFYSNDLDTTNRFIDSNWHHWAATFDAVSKARRIYRDGAQVAADTSPANFTGSGVMNVGWVAWQGNFFNGEMADLRIWKTARTAAEVAANLHGSVVPTAAGLLGNYRFNEGLGQTVGDVATSVANPDQGGPQNGAIVNDAIFLGGDAVLGRAIYLPTGQNVRITNFSALVPAQNFTIEFWQKSDLLSTGSAFALLPDNPANRLNAHLPYLGGMAYWDFGNITDASGSGRLSYTIPVSVIGNWNHFAFVAAGGNAMRIYRNGVLEAQKAVGSLFVPGAGRDLVIAPQGTVADYRIWSVARTGDQISANRFTPVPTNSTGLMVNLRFNETSPATPLADAALENGAQPGGATSGAQLIRANHEALSALMIVPVTEGAAQLIYLPAADRDSALTYASATANNGSLTLVTNGIFQYSPRGNYAGPDTVAYVVTDGARSSTGRVNVQINAVNDAPAAGAGASMSLNMAGGGGQFVDLPNDPWLGNTFTIEGWVYLRSYENYGALASFGNGLSDNNILALTSLQTSGRPTLWIYRDGAGQQVDSAQVLPLKTWTHLAFTRDAGGIGHIYLNGVETGAGEIQAPLNVMRTNNFIGTDIWGEAMNGSVAEVRVWDVARTPQELTNNFHVALPDGTGLVAYYHLNEGSGTTAFDSAAGRGLQHGTVMGSPAWMTTDGPASSIAFNGTTQYAETQTSAAVSIAGPITLEAWIRPALPGMMGIIEKYDVSAGGYALRRDPDSRIRLFMLDSDSVYSTVLGATVIPENVWTHVAGVWDGLQMKIYVNGVLDGSALSGRSPKAGNTMLVIGATGALERAYRFNGRIGDIRLWNVARNAGEISTSLAGVATNAPGLVINYKTASANTGILADLAAGDTAQNASIVGGAAWVAEQGLLAAREVIRYTEDVPLDLLLPSYDVESASLAYSNVQVSTGAVTFVSAKRYTYTPPLNYNGPATLNYTVSDGTNAASAALSLQGIAVDDPPTIPVITAPPVGEGSAASFLTVAVTDGDPELSQTLIVTATSDNPTLIRNPKVTYPTLPDTAELSYKPRPGRSGTAVITVTARDPISGATAVRTFDLVVQALNDPPNTGPATALEFNGSNFVRVASFGSVAPRDEITVEFWQFATNAAEQLTFTMDPYTGRNRIAAHVPYSDGKVYWDFGDGLNGGRLAYTPPAPIIQSWQHFAFVASKSGNYMKIFRNGIEEATKPGMSSFVQTNIDFHLGRFAGQLAEFRVWSAARTAPQIQAAMHASLPNDTTNLFAYYRFNQKPLLTLTDFASAAEQGGAQDGELVAETNPALVAESDNDPVWRTPAGTPSYQTSDPVLKALQVARIPDGATTNLFLPAWDAENGLNIAWTNVVASTGAVSQASATGLWAYTAPIGYSGPASIFYKARDSGGLITSNSVNLRIVIAQNNAPTIAAIPNFAAEENVASVEIPFIVNDDQALSQLTITPVILANPELIQDVSVSAGESFRRLTVTPRLGEIGTVHIRILVQDAGGKSAQSEFDLRIEPKPAFSVVDLGVVPGKSSSFGTAINDRGAVTGYMTETDALESNPIGFYFNGIENGGVIERNPSVGIGLGLLFSPFRSWAINNSYTLAGAGRNGGITNAWVKEIEGAQAILGVLPGGASAEIRAINDAGILAGFGTVAGGKRRAVLFAPGDAALTNLGVAPLPFNYQSEAFAINASNHIVGAVYAADGRRRAMLRKDNVMLPLFSVPDDTNSVAYGINSFDQVVGSATTFTAGDTALTFDGIDDVAAQTNLLSNPGGASLSAGNAPHTVEAWIKVNALPPVRSYPIVVGNSAAGNHYWQVNAGPTMNIGFFGTAPLSLPVTVGAWMHVAVSYDPPTTNQSVYLNGKLYQTNRLGASSVNLQGIPLYLAARDASSSNFNGSLDEVRVWRSTRTAAEIAASYNQRLSGNETDLVVYYPFDEGAGVSNVTSIAPGRLVAALEGEPTWSIRAGLPSPQITVSDPVLQLDGISSYAQAPAVTLSNRSFTVEFRARRARTNSNDDVFSQGTNTLHHGLHIGFRSTNQFTFAFTENDLNTSPMLDQEWHHWACTLNVTNRERKIYQDGVVVAQDIVTNVYEGNGLVFIGNAFGASWFKGFIDDVRIWNTARTADQIAANQDQRIASETPGLLSYFTFDEGGGTLAANRVALGGDAVLQGAITWAGRDSGSLRAFLYDSASSRLQSLGSLPGGGSSEAKGINEFGQIVGNASPASSPRAFFYSAGRLNDLNDLLPEIDQFDGWTLETGNGINRSGAIVGTGRHKGLRRAFMALPATVIGRPVIRPQGAVERLPAITILKQHLPDDTAANSFYWSPPEKKLYAIRPVTAKIDWFTSLDNFTGTGTNIVAAGQITSISVNVWPKDPILHVAGAPVDLQPAFTGATYSFQSLIYVTNKAAVEPSSKVFTSPTPGYTVAYYLKSEGLTPNPESQRPYFDVIRTVDLEHANVASQEWTIGAEVTEAGHTEYLGKNGYVLFEKAAYDAVGPERAYDRGTRLGSILPVNTEKPGNNQLANPDPLIVVWYRTNRIGVAWASVAVRYSLNWPADNVVNKIIIARANGSWPLSSLSFPAKTIYHQPDVNQPGFNPNEEHALMLGDTLFALRDDLNRIRNYSEPYALLKYRDPATARWQMRVYKVVAEEAPYFFAYSGVVGLEIQPPMPLSVLPFCEASYAVPADSTVGWKDYHGKIYARQAGPNGTHTNLVIRWLYPMQPEFYHPDSAVHAGDCIAWLDRRSANKLAGPNAGAGTRGTPVDVTYDIRWDDHRVLQIGETLLSSKNLLPNVYDLANAEVIFDSLEALHPDGDDRLARFYDPISARTLTSGVRLPDGVKLQNINGKNYFTDLPWMLKIRLTHDPVNNWLSFSGYLDEQFGAGEPLLLPNVLSSRERQRLIALGNGSGTWTDLMNQLYNLTRNPNGVDLDDDGAPDQALRVGLTTIETPVGFKVVPETFGDGPKALTAGVGGIAAVPAMPGNALAFNGTNGLVTISPSVNLVGSSFTVEFWAQAASPVTEQYIFAQAGGAADFGAIRIGFRDSGKFAFDLGTNAASLSIFNTSGAYTDTNWHHWACAFDANKHSQAIYRDGALVAARTNASLVYNGAGQIELGRAGNRYFRGRLDEIRVWTDARSQSQIRAKMSKRLLGLKTDAKGSEYKLELLYRCDESGGNLLNDSPSTNGLFSGVLTGGATRVVSDASAGIPPRYVTIAANNEASPAGLPVVLHVIRIDDGPFRGDLKALPGDNVFDERLTLRHSSDFGGDPDPFTFQWYYKPISADFDPTALPIVTDTGLDLNDWIPFPENGAGVNFITTGEGAESGLITLSDNAFICRYKGYSLDPNGESIWSGWIGDPSGSAEQPRAIVAEGWVKRVIRGLNPFDARTSDFHSSPSVTFSSMLIQAGARYEGPIAFNPSADAINKVGLIEAYTTVFERAKRLSIEGVPQVDFNPANTALQLAATKISDLYMLLGNEAYADASDPTIGFSSGSREYGSLASSIFAFQNQLDSLLDEELGLLRGRDDSAAGVSGRPIYNRLFWNFTLGEGEVAYQQNYNISDQDSDGFISEKDARILYPQGHGDAWGHYLTALKQQYALLRHPFFTWIPRSEFVNVAGSSIKVDFLDERKFARGAAAKAKAGAEIVDLTYRLNYVEDPAGQWQGYKDNKADRAWGVTEWGRRAGMGAYFDWLTGNAILPSVDPNPNHTGIDKIDRQTVRELHEIPAQFDEIQSRLDQADAGLNPLGLAKGTVPFDIDPSLVSAGKTHYEQIQDRALKAMNNAMAVWDEVNKATSSIRRNQDAVEEFNSNVEAQERDYKNRLIEIMGYPYAGDIGAGKTYPSGYDGPDLYHYMYVTTTELNSETVDMTEFNGFFKGLPASSTDSAGVHIFGNRFFPADLPNPLVGNLNRDETFNLKFPFSPGPWGFKAPTSWGQRRAPGTIQAALQEWIEQEGRLKQSMVTYGNLIRSVDDAATLLSARYAVRQEIRTARTDTFDETRNLRVTLQGLKGLENIFTLQKEVIKGTSEVATESVPKVVGLATDAFVMLRGTLKGAAEFGQRFYDVGVVTLKSSQLAVEESIISAENSLQLKIDDATFSFEVKQHLNEIKNLVREEAVLRAEIFTQNQILEQAQGRWLAEVARAQRLMEERLAFRKSVAGDTTERRYQDMTFRIFRNDALQKYRASFDLAQKYVFLAATAYDYESNLLGTDSRGGRAFLTDIIRQRSLGQMLNGQPVIGRSGLADPLARMGSNFDVLKTQLGFNNPQTETGRFSLRNELFRLRNSSDQAWRGILNDNRVANLWNLPEFRRYCRSFAPESAGAQPGIVIRFPTSVLAGLNFFNRPLGGGDSAYDPSRFATKIRSAGVWFTGYNGLGLSQTPRIYLVPVGADVLSSPTANDFQAREWRVVDQQLPVPFPIGANTLSSPSWIPVNDSLGGSFAELRRFSSFRAYHDSGGFSQSEVTSDSRLIGRSVWNSEWMLIIPGQTFLANADGGLEAFIASVTDIKLFFQTYSYSGN